MMAPTLLRFLGRRMAWLAARVRAVAPAPIALVPVALASLALAPLALAGVALTAAPVSAQDNLSEARLRKIEAEIRALQRNVFPGGNEQYFEPQIQPEGPSGESAAGAAAGAPSTSALTDILARLDAIELQLQRLTAITEENTNAIALLTARVDEVELSRTPALPLDASVTGEEGAAPSVAAADGLLDGVAGEAAEEAAEEAVEEVAEVAADEAADGTADEPETAMSSNLAAMGAVVPAASEEPDAPVPAPPAGAAPALVAPTPERVAAVQEITKPQTDDAADDEYSYGYRLWNAGFYPEARQQLAKFVDAYPDHWRATYGRNLLGRAYLDDGQPEDAARWFLRNYQADRTAARAPDSLLFLAESMIALEDTRRACIALAEFGETYPAVATGRLLEKYQASRTRVTCES
ncbi:MAG: tetratricopeptide repeat protein [Pseudomonadota bacterium]